ncbi:MAG: hypothetical protein KKB51_11760 [Candidatus Riflebacteria bacterium]|nr:hypothetical protein [Candidatus Riflebacteria bacterium]
MNTRISYQYRDASNYKLFNEIVIAGELNFSELEPFLIDGQFFVPEELYIPRLSFENSNEDDHDWHEIIKLELCDDPPDSGINKIELLKLAKESPNERCWKPYYKSLAAMNTKKHEKW